MKRTKVDDERANGEGTMIKAMLSTVAALALVMLMTVLVIGGSASILA